jgi:hypothetical protein
MYNLNMNLVVKKVAAAASKEKDKKDAEVMRRASVGSLTCDEI